ncbi:AraC family transcriptional regulator [Actinophytocola sp.]|uniref:AraC family transcriptional regulator n=1 Tax=Actinophytocola sp. TaxID=1872138 RepID=UPI00389A1E1B
MANLPTSMTTGSGRLPEVLVRSRDVDEAREVGTRVLHPHRLTVVGDVARFGMTLHLVAAGSLDIGWLRYETETCIASSHPGHYQVNVPLAGTMVATSCGQEVLADAGTATVYNPDRPAAFTVPGPVLALRISRRELEHQLERLLDRPLRRPPQLALGMNVASGRGAQWLALVQAMARDLADDNALIRQPMVAAPFAHAVLSGLLVTATHTHQDELIAPVAAIGQATVRTARAYIEANAHQPLTVADIARASGVGVRGLQLGFQRALGMSPMRYLRRVRLQQAHRELRMADPATTSVGDVATRWGFRHHGRFAAEYRQHYGVTPSETLRHHR